MVVLLLTMDTESDDWGTLAGEIERLRPEVENGPAWERMHQRMAALRNAPSPRLHRDAPRRQSWGWVVAAAAVVGVAVGIWHVASPASVLVRDFTTPAGARATIHLRDGTQLTLGPASHVRIAADYGRRERSITLDGEALFSVVHNSRAPLVVHTAYGDIHDVGTVFVVRAYDADHDAQVAVSEGMVSMAGTVLAAHDLASVGPDGHTWVRRHVDVTAFFAWPQGILAFSDTPLRDVVRAIARRFDVNVTLADSSLAGLNVTASFTTQGVDTILDEITAITGAEYRRIGRTIVIRRATGHSTHTRSDTLWHPPVTVVTARDPHE